MYLRPRFDVMLASLVAIGVAGAGISIYLIVVHYAKVPLVCSTSGLINCERVLSSRYSAVGGVPISIGGIVWFVVLALLGLAGLLVAPEPRLLHPVQVLWSLLGLVMVLYLVGIETLALGVLCIWCTVLHMLILAALVLTLLRTPEPSDGEPASERSAKRRNTPGATG